MRGLRSSGPKACSIGCWWESASRASRYGCSTPETAVLIGMVYSYLPFMVLPIYAVLEKMDRSLIEAAADLGAKPLTRFLTITVPLAKPGISPDVSSFSCRHRRIRDPDCSVARKPL